MTIRDDILAALEDDGDIYKFDDGRELRLRIEHDEDHSILDEEMHGEFAWPGRTNDYGRYDRPAGFDGNAELLGFGRSYDRIWWQPPRGDYALYDDGKPARRGSKAFEEYRTTVLELLEYGYVGVIVELWHSCPTCASRHEDRSASLWGVEWNADDAYKREVIGDLIDELEI